MNAFFRWLLEASWQGAVVALLIFVAQWALGKRLAPKWRYGLWFLLMARLVLPSLPESSVSVYNLVRKEPSPLAGTMVKPVRTQENLVEASTTVGPVAPAYPLVRHDPLLNTTKPPVKRDWMAVAFWVWAAGVGLLGVRLVWSNGRFRSQLGKAEDVKGKGVIDLFEECRKSYGIRGRVWLVECAEVEAPAVWGLWRKWLLLPEGSVERFAREELRLIFLHELAHIKRGDLAVNWLAAALQIAHWFNPVLWLAWRRMKADRELATDALALAHAGEQERVAYGETILKVVEGLAGERAMPSLVGIGESKVQLEARLIAIARPGKSWKLAAVTAAALVAAVGLTDAQTKKAAKTPTGVVSGTIFDSDGKPAANAQVALFKPKSELALDGTPHLFNPEFSHAMSGVKEKPYPWSFCTTGEDGRFYLDDVADTMFLLAADGKGFAKMDAVRLSTNMSVRLQKWGRVEGTIWDYDRPFVGAEVAGGLKGGQTKWTEGINFRRTTDDAGRYSFDYIPPGEAWVRGADNTAMATVQPGTTTEVNLGQGGREVIGKFRSGDPKTQAQWERLSDYYDLETEPQHPAKPFTSRDEYEEWRSENQPAHFWYYQFKCAPDGSFRIEHVKPGRYAIFFRTHNNQSPHIDEGRDLIAACSGFDHTFEIPAPGKNAREPVDLGVVDVLGVKRQSNRTARSNEEDIGPTLTGTVWTPDGKPAPLAQVGLKRPRRGLQFISNFENSGKSGVLIAGETNDNLAQADRRAVFSLPMLDTVEALWAASDEGYAILPREALSNGMRVVLQPWARVEGVMRLNHAPAPYEEIELVQDGEHYLAGRMFAARLTTDGEGKFRFDKVPAGYYSLCRLLKQGNGMWSTDPKYLTVRSGETTEVMFGGDGRPVKGRFVRKGVNPLGSDATYSVRLQTPWPRASGMTAQEFWAWRKTPPGLAAFEKYRDYGAYAKEDGSFEVWDVEPGTYDISFSSDSHDPNDPFKSMQLNGQPQTVAIPALTDPTKVETFDLGDIESKYSFSVFKGSGNWMPQWQVGTTAPELEGRMASGEALRLKDYRGKYVLLDLCQMLPGPETEELEAVAKTFADDDRLAIVSYSMDANDAVVKRLQRGTGTRWHLGIISREAEESNGTFSPHETPILLIDPDGKIKAHVGLGQIQAAVAKVLGKS